MLIRTILYQHIKILVKHLFLLNFRHELLSFEVQTKHVRSSRSIKPLFNPSVIGIPLTLLI